MAHRLKRLYDPVSFQGGSALRDPGSGRGYFEGWYFKSASRSGEVVAFIPGVSISRDPHAFIQVNDGPARQGRYFRFPLSLFRASGPGEEFRIEIGRNSFSRQGLSVDLSDQGARYRARIAFDGMVGFPPRPLSPGIMGWYSFLPFMECYHGLVSLSHGLAGRIATPSGGIDLDGGRGYIEKDWGRSFPEAWVWMQTNAFGDQDASFMLSVAKIPWLGRSFPGFLSFLRFGGRTRVFATHNGSRIREAKAGPSSFEALIERGSRRLRIRAEYGSGGTLSAPVDGGMSRPIKESVDSRVTVDYLEGKDGPAFSGTGIAAGLEMVGRIEGLPGGRLQRGASD